MDISGARALATSVAAWSGAAATIRSKLVQAEFLSDIHGCNIAVLDELGADGARMAAHIRRAADDLSSFTISLASPAAIVAAVGSVHSFGGTDNDPELDRRLRALRGLVDAATASDEQASAVMRALLAAGETGDIAAAMSHIQRITQTEAVAPVSSHDDRVDDAVRQLRVALTSHASSNEHLNHLTAAFLADGNRTPAAILLASLLTGYAPSAVELAHRNGWDYEVATGRIDSTELDQLTVAIRTAPLPEVAELERQRSELFAQLSGVTDQAVIDQFGRMADSGVTAIETIPKVLEEVEQAAIDRVAQEHGLDSAAAALQFDFMRLSVDELVLAGYDLQDAADVVTVTSRDGRDIAPILALAESENLTLSQASARLDRAKELGMTVDELDAFLGFYEHFEFFDQVRTGESDGVVSVADLRFVVNNYRPGNEDAMRAAAAFLDAEGLRHRIDSAAQTGSVVSNDPFGSDRPGDYKYSRADVHLLVDKQETNYALRRIIGPIDAAGDGGAIGWADGNLSEFDFEHVRAHHREYGLTEAEVAAIDRVLELDWYHPTFWQEHSDSFILGAAVVAGALAVTLAGPAGGSVANLLISSAVGATAGASTGAGMTVVENAFTGDPLTEDLLKNTVLGAVGGSAGAGMAGYANGAGQPLTTRMLEAVGTTADTAGLVSAGLLDPALGVFIDDIDLDTLHGDFQWVNYGAGALSVTSTASTLPGEAASQALARAGGVGLDRVLAGEDDTVAGHDLDQLEIAPAFGG